MKVIPKFLNILFQVELFERIGYYGLRALLVLFLLNHYGFQDSKVYGIYAIFSALVYISPSFASWITDKMMGFKHMLILSGFIILLGNLLILSSYYFSHNFFLGAGLLVVGTGIFKANLNNLLGACYEKYSLQDRTNGFVFLHVGVNIGAAVGSILCGYIAHFYGWYYAFTLTTLNIFLAMAIFLKNQKVFENYGNSPKPELINQKKFGLKFSHWVFITMLIVGLFFGNSLIASWFGPNLFHYFGFGMLCVFFYTIFRQKERGKLIALGFLMFCLIIAFAIEMQLGALFAIFAERNVVQKVFGIIIPSSVSQAINPVFIVLFGLMMTKVRGKKSKNSIARFIIGLLAISACFLILYYGCLHADIHHRVPYIYFILAVAMIAISEITLWPFVQSMVTLLSPANLQGFMMSLLMLFMAFSNIFGMYIANFFAVPVNKGVYDSALSLAKYKEGFFKGFILNTGWVILFIPIFFFINKVINQSMKKSK